MVRLPQALESKRITLLALARRRAFESYLRYGRVPQLHEQAAAFAVGAEKALGPEVDVAVSALPRPRPTAYYTWRTAGDERVRAGHAAHAGQVFAWAGPPVGGHPGAAPNCRCWAEPYYGNPSVPDALLKLAHERQVDTSGRELWASIDTLTRPDGSLVESAILGRDGAQFRSIFSGASVAHAVTLPSGDKVRFATVGGVQSIYLGDDAVPLMQSAWTPKGPKVQRARRDVAFVLRNPTDPFGDVTPYAEPGPASVSGLPAAAAGGLSLAGLAMFALHAMQQAAPTAMGLAAEDESFVAFRAWTRGEETTALPVLVGALTEEQARLTCRLLPEVQQWVNQAATTLAPQRQAMSQQQWGTAVHKVAKDIFTALKAAFPELYANAYAEVSADSDEFNIPYGRRGSTRFDVYEDRRADLGAVCVYDYKAGAEGLTAKRVAKIAEVVRDLYGNVIVYIFEMRPAP